MVYGSNFKVTLARATPYLPKQLLKLAYTALIRSYLEYCSSFYSSVAKTHLKKLDVRQGGSVNLWSTVIAFRQLVLS